MAEASVGLPPPKDQEKEPPDGSFVFKDPLDDPPEGEADPNPHESLDYPPKDKKPVSSPYNKFLEIRDGLPVWVLWMKNRIPNDEFLIPNWMEKILVKVLEPLKDYFHEEVPVRFQIGVLTLMVFLVLSSMPSTLFRVVVGGTTMAASAGFNLLFLCATIALVSTFVKIINQKRSEAIFSPIGFLVAIPAVVLFIPGAAESIGPAKIVGLSALLIVVVIVMQANHLARHSSEGSLKVLIVIGMLFSLLLVIVSVVSSEYSLTFGAIIDCRTIGLDEASVLCRTSYLAEQVVEMRQRRPLVKRGAFNELVATLAFHDSRNLVDDVLKGKWKKVPPDREVFPHFNGWLSVCLEYLAHSLYLGFLGAVLVAYAARSFHFLQRLRSFREKTPPPFIKSPGEWKETDPEPGFCQMLMLAPIDTVILTVWSQMLWKVVQHMYHMEATIVLVGFLLVFLFYIYVKALGGIMAASSAAALDMIKGKTYLTSLDYLGEIIDIAPKSMLATLAGMQFASCALASWVFWGFLSQPILAVGFCSACYIGLRGGVPKQRVPVLLLFVTSFIMQDWLGTVAYVSFIASWFVVKPPGTPFASAVPPPVLGNLGVADGGF